MKKRLFLTEIILFLLTFCFGVYINADSGMADEEVKLGDLSGSGSIGATDVALLARYVIGEIDEFPVDADPLEIGDISGSSSIGSSDVVYLQQYVLGKIDELPGAEDEKPTCEDWTVVNQASGEWDEFYVTDDEIFVTINNTWGADAHQVMYKYECGAYGFEWQRGETGIDSPNYPEVLVGVKPWGTHEFRDSGLPLQLHEIETLEMEVVVDYEIEEGYEDHEWNLAFELWITDEKPGDDVSDTIYDEIMLWFDWQPGLWDFVDPVDTEAVQDGEHTYELRASVSGWGDQGMVGGGWQYTQYRVGEKGNIPRTIDLKKILDDHIERTGRDQEAWLGALELGMEYCDHTAGNFQILELNYNINGNRIESGVGHAPGN